MERRNKQNKERRGAI
jgi:hypothetical protein